MAAAVSLFALVAFNHELRIISLKRCPQWIRRVSVRLASAEVFQGIGINPVLSRIQIHRYFVTIFCNRFSLHFNRPIMYVKSADSSRGINVIAER